MLVFLYRAPTMFYVVSRFIFTVLIHVIDACYCLCVRSSLFLCMYYLSLQCGSICVDWILHFVLYCMFSSVLIEFNFVCCLVPFVYAVAFICAALS